MTVKLTQAGSMRDTRAAKQLAAKEILRRSPAHNQPVVFEWGSEAQVGTGDTGLRATFFRRVRSWAEDVALTAPEEVLADALANPSVRGGLVKLLTETSAETDHSPATRLREKALARGLAEKESLRERAGGFKPTAWVGEHLGISRQAVDKRRKAGRLLAVAAADGTFAYPMCQFTPDGVVPGLEEALAAFEVESPWERLSALVNPAPALGGKSVLTVLGTSRSEQDREQALAVIREFLR